MQEYYRGNIKIKNNQTGDFFFYREIFYFKGKILPKFSFLKNNVTENVSYDPVFDRPFFRSISGTKKLRVGPKKVLQFSYMLYSMYNLS